MDDNMAFSNVLFVEDISDQVRPTSGCVDLSLVVVYSACSSLCVRHNPEQFKHI